MRESPRLLTAEDLLDPVTPYRDCELWDGTAVVREPSGSSHARSHRDAMLFGAGEYEQLAASIQSNAADLDANRECLIAKATWLRKRAAQ